MKDRKAENQNERCLETHHKELRGDVRGEYFDAGNSRHETSFQNTLISLDQHGARCESHGQEENNSGEKKIIFQLKSLTLADLELDYLVAN